MNSRILLLNFNENAAMPICKIAVFPASSPASHVEVERHLHRFGLDCSGLRFLLMHLPFVLSLSLSLILGALASNGSAETASMSATLSALHSCNLALPSYLLFRFNRQLEAADILFRLSASISLLLRFLSFRPKPGRENRQYVRTNVAGLLPRPNCKLTLS